MAPWTKHSTSSPLGALAQISATSSRDSSRARITRDAPSSRHTRAIS